MLSYNEITSKKVIIFNDEPYEVLSSWVFRKQQRKPVNQAKLRNVRTGGALEYTFHQNDKVEEAELETKQALFIYSRGGEMWLCDPKDRSKRFSIPADIVGDTIKYLKENTIVDTVVFDENIIQVRIPIKVELEVTEAPPNVKGNTAQGGVKPVVLETGAVVNTPMFINVGDVIRVNTETGEYTERV
jgi:elongation factor P